MTSTSLFRLCGAALLVAAGCGSGSKAGPSGSGGSSATGSAGNTASGAGGTSGTSGAAGTTGSGVAGTSGAAGSSGGTTASGAAGSGVGGTNTVDAGKLGTTQCSDGIDNDGDGLIDLADPECVGPLDNDESSFATGIPGDNIDPCKQDCFFDGNSGMGDDGCLWQLKCDPQSVEPKCPYDPNYAAQHTMECSVSMSQSATCVSKCQKLVPNGCDCFGCCLIPGASTPIRLAATCTAAAFNDPTKCPPCTQVTQCSNPCGHCELCIGKTTLPPDCYEGGDGGTDSGTDGPPGQQCGSDYVPCGPGTSIPLDGCPANYGCITGCCIPTAI
ncbi:MAG TPA: hypothetical protein VKQ32_15695 [Polyangia bacterium]|nr:hypothetical protein [Polyangia bacterium]